MPKNEHFRPVDPTFRIMQSIIDEGDRNREKTDIAKLSHDPSFSEIVTQDELNTIRDIEVRQGADAVITPLKTGVDIVLVPKPPETS